MGKILSSPEAAVVCKNIECEECQTPRSFNVQKRFNLLQDT